MIFLLVREYSSIVPLQIDTNTRNLHLKSNTDIVLRETKQFPFKGAGTVLKFFPYFTFPTKIWPCHYFLAWRISITHKQTGYVGYANINCFVNAYTGLQNSPGIGIAAMMLHHPTPIGNMREKKEQSCLKGILHVLHIISFNSIGSPRKAQLYIFYRN